MLLQRISTGRTGQAFKFILLAVLFAAVAGLVLTDAGGFFRRGGVSRQDVARVGDRKINVNEFAQLYRRTLQQSGYKEDAAKKMGLPYMVLQQEISRHLLQQTADAMGIRVSNAAVAHDLTDQLNQMKMPGTNKEKLDLILQHENMNEAQFVDTLRGEFAGDLLRSSVANPGLTVPPTLINALYQTGNEKRAADLVTISLADAKVNPVIDDKALNAYYNDNKEKYRLPEQRDLAFLILPKILYAAKTDVSDAEITAYYDEHKNDFVSADRVQLEQAIALDKASADKIMADKPATLSTVKSDKVQTLAVDWYTKSSLPKELSAALFTAKPTGLVGPVQSALGWHVLRVVQYEGNKPLTLDEAKDTIKRQLQDEKLDKVMNDFSSQVDTMAASGSSLTDIAKEYKLTVKPVDGVTVKNISEKLNPLALDPTTTQHLAQNVMALGDGEVSPLIDMPNGDYLLVQVTKVAPSAVPQLNTITDQIKTDALNAAKTKGLNDYAEAIIADYDSKKPTAFYQTLKDKNLAVKHADPGTHAQALEKFGPEVSTMIFTLSPDNDLSYTNGADGVTLVWLKSISHDKAAPDKDTVAKTGEALKKMLAQEMQQEFMAAWEKKMGVTINSDLMREQFVDQNTAQN